MSAFRARSVFCRQCTRSPSPQSPVSTTFLFRGDERLFLLLARDCVCGPDPVLTGGRGGHTGALGNASVLWGVGRLRTVMFHVRVTAG